MHWETASVGDGVAEAEAEAEEERRRGEAMSYFSARDRPCDYGKLSVTSVIKLRRVSGKVMGGISVFCSTNLLPCRSPAESIVNRHPMFAKRRGDSP